MYGKRRFSKKSSSSRAGGATRMRRGSTYKKVGSSYSKSRSVVGQRLTRREIKYDDDYYSLQAWSKTVSQGGMNSIEAAYTNWVLGGVIQRSSSDWKMTAGGNAIEGYVAQDEYSPNCLTNIGSGTTASTRIGNMVQPRYITVKGVINAGMTNNPRDGETTWRAESGKEPITMVNRYMRTSVRLIILRDKSMNEKGFVEYSDVFEQPGADAGPNPYLWNRKIDTIGRYQILKTMEYDLDQDDPQRTFSYNIPLNGIAIRFNGSVIKSGHNTAGPTAPWYNGMGGVEGGTTTSFTLRGSADAQSMTNGIYLLAVAHCGTEALGAPERYKSPSLVFSSRLTFED